MKSLKALLRWVAVAFGIAFVLYIAFYLIFLNLLVDLWWYQSLKLEAYFWLRHLYKFLLSGGVTLVFFAIFFFHFWIASRYLGLTPPDDILMDSDKNRRFEGFVDTFLNGSMKVYTPISLLLAILIAIPFYNQWETTLLYFFGRDSGVTESVYGNDVSFYMLSYPTYMLIQQILLTTTILIFCLVGLLYWLKHVFIPDKNSEFPLGAKIHLSVLMSVVVAIVVWGFLLDRFTLLYTDLHEPVFYGPGFIEIRYKLPLIWLGIVTFLATAIMSGLFIFSEKHRVKRPLLISLTLFIIVIGVPKIQWIPNLIEKYIVNPNPVKANQSFIQYNIDATLDAYDLKNVKTVDMAINLDAAKDIDTWSTQKHFENIPVWDREYIIDSYKQLQEIRPYYKIMSVDEDRYFIHDHTRQVDLSAREINVSMLPSEAQNWENIHLRYTHGYGAVVTPAAQDAEKPLVWYLRDLNLHSDVGLSIKHPDIYYGQENFEYAIVPNKLKLEDISGSDPGLADVYQGEGGVPISSLFRKALFSTYLKDEKVFFSPNISTTSKLKIYRNIAERINKLTPFLHLDKDAYLVITDDRFYWIQDAYTLSDKYPYSQPANENFLIDKSNFNYIRNSVKIVVDAYDGDVNYYISDPSDSIVNAYNRAYPGLFKSLDKMPEELRKHLRYPRDYFYLQMKVYAKYHQKSPGLFYEQAETWEFANIRGQQVLPYYQTMDFGSCDDTEEFVLITPMTPVNRGNLSMIGIASTLDKTECSSDYKPGITVFKFGREVQVNGPAQIEALTQQDPEISAQFTLWNQSESIVEMGRIVILPMGNTILYVQPIYIASTKDKMPELTRIIVSIGNELVMDKSLWSAFNRLKQIFIKNAAEGNSTAIFNGIVEQKK
jgi:uncharacterized membrane protein (UPF0182 family)